MFLSFVGVYFALIKYIVTKSAKTLSLLEFTFKVVANAN